ncbi:uncharacterized protein LOC141728025 isoform X2 [Zonotrichia albicollis]|uniref:uncharacterized protein LOC141728025 isoform X2 n=1 Tax=Zonotrichia albicollis TaxID=44394 RepID=UPI003D80F0DE
MAAPPEPPSRGSRLPVGRAQDKRAPSEGPPAAPPQQKRSRTGLGAPLGTLGRDAAAGENDGPREAASVAAAPRAGSVPSTSSKGASKRPPWDLRGQLRDLRKALGQAEERLQGLESEKRELESSNQQLRERLQRESPESSRCTQVSSLELQQSWDRVEALEAEERRLRHERDEALGRAQELADQLENARAQLQQTQQQLQEQLEAMTALRELEASQRATLVEYEERIHLLEMEIQELQTDAPPPSGGRSSRRSGRVESRR